MMETVSICKYFNYAKDNQLEKFYKEIYEDLFFIDGVEYNEEIKFKMSIFSLAYDIAKLFNPHNIEDYNLQIENILYEVRKKSNFKKGGNESKKYFKKIIIILLKDLDDDKKQIYKNIFGDKTLIYIKSQEKTNKLNLDKRITAEIKETNKTLYDILISDNFKNSTNRENHLNEKGFYKDRGVEELFYQVIGKCEITQDEFNKKWNQFNLAYDLGKYKFRYNKRDSGERYFNHLTSVMTLYLENEENPTFKGAIIALLHDIMEDTDINDNDLNTLFGKEISNGVIALSKPSVEIYLKEETEKTFFKNGKKNGFLNSKGDISDYIIFKERKGLLNRLEKKKLEKYKKINKKYKKTRNEEYFKKFLEKLNRTNLSKAEEEQVKIKFYDRIHNTKTLLGFKDKNKIFDKIYETITYFLPINLEPFQKVNELLIVELEKTLLIIENTFKNNLYNEDKNKLQEIKNKLQEIKNNTVSYVKEEVVLKSTIIIK